MCSWIANAGLAHIFEIIVLNEVALSFSIVLQLVALDEVVFSLAHVLQVLVLNKIAVAFAVVFEIGIANEVVFPLAQIFQVVVADEIALSFAVAFEIGITNKIAVAAACLCIGKTYHDGLMLPLNGGEKSQKGETKNRNTHV